LTYLITLIVAYCSIVYELLMAQTLSALLGNTVLRYSVTIGVYLASLGVGAMLCKKGDEQSSIDRLVQIEIWLSIVGGLAVVMLGLFAVAQRYLGTFHSFFSQGLGSSIGLILFFILCHAIIVVIGVLSGFEIPLLIALGEARKPNSMNIVLAIDYFGSLFGAILFPLVLLPQLGLFAAAYLTGLLNAAACGLILIFKPARKKLRYAKMIGAVAILLLLLLAFTQNTHQFFLKKLYHYQPNKNISALQKPFEGHSNNEEHSSFYQQIIPAGEPGHRLPPTVYSQYNGKFNNRLNAPKDL